MSASVALDRSVTISEGGTAFDCVLLAMTQARLGNRDQAQGWFTETLRLTGQMQADHPELRRLCDEAGSLLQALHETSAIIP